MFQVIEEELFINYGNQPSMQTGYIFNYFGQPWLTQKWVREVIDEVYSDNDPQHGYSGDEDQGLMGALCVLMKIGLFEMKGGQKLTLHMIFPAPYLIKSQFIWIKIIIRVEILK